MQTNTGGTALITGASSGIGLHLAHQFARYGHDVLLVAPNPAELAEVASAIEQEFQVRATAVAADLTEPDSIRDLVARVNGADAPVDVLVNNAGCGRRGPFWEQTLDDDLAMIRLNVEGTVRVTRAFLRAMVQRGRGRVLNTASIASFEPGPLMAVYHATKAFVLTFSESIAVELEETGVTVTALCPGPTDTDFFPKADMIDTRAFQEANLMAPQDVAAAAYKGLMAGDRVVVPGALNKASVASRRILPAGAQAKKNRKLYEQPKTLRRKRERGAKESKTR